MTAMLLFKSALQTNRSFIVDAKKNTRLIVFETFLDVLLHIGFFSKYFLKFLEKSHSELQLKKQYKKNLATYDSTLHFKNGTLVVV